MREREDLCEQNRQLKRALSAACIALRTVQYGTAEREMIRREADLGERLLAQCGGVEPPARVSSDASRTEVSEGRR